MQALRGLLFLFTGWGIVLGIYWLISYPYVELLGLPFYSFLFFMTFSALSLSIPSAPAGIGVMHYGLFLSIKLLNPESITSQINMVAAFVIVMHFFITLLDIVTGGIIIFFNKLIYNSVKKT